MRKWLLYPIWDLQKLEEKLEDLEQSGYRLCGVRCFRLFCFEQATPKKVRYFITTYADKELTMGDMHAALLREYRANVMGVYGLYLTFCAHRITDTSWDLQEMERLRKPLLRRCLWKGIGFHMIWLVLSGAGFCLLPRLDAFSVFLAALFVLELAVVLYHGVGLCWLKR